MEKYPNYLAARTLFKGTSNTSSSPNLKVTYDRAKTPPKRELRHRAAIRQTTTFRKKKQLPVVVRHKSPAAMPVLKNLPKPAAKKSSRQTALRSNNNTTCPLVRNQSESSLVLPRQQELVFSKNPGPLEKGISPHNTKELQETIAFRKETPNTESGFFLTEIDHETLYKDSITKLATVFIKGLENNSTCSPKESIDAYNKVLTIALKLHNDGMAGLMYHHIGNSFKELRDYKYAIEMQNVASALADKIMDDKLKARALKSIGVCQMAMGQYEVSITTAKNALDLATDDVELQGRVHANLGNAFRLLCQYEKAIEHHSLDLKKSLEVDSFVGQARAYHNLSLVYHEMKNFRIESEYRSKAAVFSQINLPLRDMKKHPDTSVGNIYLQLSNPNPSLVSLVKDSISQQQQHTAHFVAPLE